MATRVVTGTFRHLDKSLWVGGRVIIRLTGSTYDTTDQYPSGEIVLTTDDAGTISTELWCNADGVVPARYQCTEPDGSTFFFVLAAGSGPIDLTILRAGGAPFTPANPLYTAAQGLVDTEADTRATADTNLQNQINNLLTILFQGTLDFSQAANSGLLTTGL